MFDADDVAPPEDCSRCGKPVAKTSLFCPACGQSRVTPLPAPVDEPPASEPDEPEGDQGAPVADQPPPSTTDTLSRATQWIRKTLGGSVEVPRVEPEPAGQAEPAEDPLVRENSRPSYPERLQQSSRSRARFVLTDATGRSFTIGEMPGGLAPAMKPPRVIACTGFTSPPTMARLMPSTCGLVWTRVCCGWKTPTRCLAPSSPNRAARPCSVCPTSAIRLCEERHCASGR